MPIFIYIYIYIYIYICIYIYIYIVGGNANIHHGLDLVNDSTDLFLPNLKEGVGQALLTHLSHRRLKR